ncbi:DUF1349 domain-containing protein [Phytoactinopolyspora halotolerans]|uniref:DUF1349 domain-containing protein n=1 Tax=Phytoactinopolyspora halotolerans TaxID=1981512 RepID=A0A6L9S3K3_9ACTN|nr:DUF1349 domain-containing protein [Phytoactinopolyspora halotolerans]NED99616.1 DUF1349 domain-containing protein [Phytoactinopolyspora halotolerans]
MATFRRRSSALVLSLLLPAAALIANSTNAAATTGFVSDDFSAGLDSEVWTVVDPVGDGTSGVAGAGTSARLELSLPAGTSHDPWGTNRALRAVQNVPDGDVEIEAKFDSVPSGKFQMQGLLFEQDAGNWLRFDTYHNGSSLYVFAASTTAGSSKSMLSKAITTSPDSIWLRVTRSGSTWTYKWSADGENFNTAGSFSRSMNVTSIGPFAANHNSPKSASPAFAAEVDYVIDTSAPIQPDPEPDPDPTTDPEPDPDPTTDPEPDPDPTTDPEPDPDPTTDPEPDPDVVRIMPVGDSITRGATSAGSGIQGTYRYYLDDHLNDSEVDFDFVGPYDSHPAGDHLAEGEWDHDSLSVQGWTTGHLRDNIAAGVTDHDPDVVLLLIGINDLRGATITPEIAAERVDTAIARARNVKPDLAILIAEIPPDSMNTAKVTAYNAELRTLAANRTSGASPIHTVDMNTGYEVAVHAYDGLHPNAVGDRLIADRWAEALDTFLDVGDGPPETGDSTPPVISTVDVDMAPGTATITWQTNEPATSAVAHGATAAYGSGTISADSLVTDHTVTLPDLQPSSTYHYQVISTDESGNIATTADATFTTPDEGPHASSSVIRSDDFSNGLDDAVWTVVDPIGDGSWQVAGQGTDDAHLELTVPASTSHDAWGANRSLRAMQDVTNEDFEAEVRFDSVPSSKYQMQGVIVQQDASNWIRFDTYFDGTSLRVFAASTTGGSSAAKISKVIPAGATSMWLRVKRTGSTWTYSWSANGVSWTEAGSFTRALNVTSVGPFAANHNSPASASPAFTARVNYVIDTEDPDPPEPGNYTLTTQTIGQGSIVSTPDETSYPAGAMVELEAVPADGWSFTGWSGALSGASNPASVTMSSHTTVSATFVEDGQEPDPGDGPAIDVWNGNQQTFGANGRPQRWVNVLGNVSHPDGLSWLRFRLNGGPLRNLKIGPDLQRLQFAGDFNVELDYAELAGGANTVELIARSTSGVENSRTVTVTKESSTVPSLPFQVDWSDAAAINDVAQIVDGKWSINSGALRPTELGYDRVVALGDISWTDYQVTVPLTVHALGPDSGTPQSGAPLVGMGLRWPGHTTGSSGQPSTGFYPVGAYAWYRWQLTGRTELTGSGGTPLHRINHVSLPLGVPHVMKASVETVTGGYRYRYKMWPAAEPEPGWQMEIVYDGGTASGAVALIAHHVDASFGNVVIEPIQ